MNQILRNYIRVSYKSSNLYIAKKNIKSFLFINNNINVGPSIDYCDDRWAAPREREKYKSKSIHIELFKPVTYIKEFIDKPLFSDPKTYYEFNNVLSDFVIKPEDETYDEIYNQLFENDYKFRR